MKKIIWLGGFLILTTIISLGTRTSCRAGWEEVLEGEYQGYYNCITKAGNRYQLCVDVYDSETGRNNYWCEKGEPKEEEVIPQIENIKYNNPSGGYHHTKDGCIDCK